LFAHVLSACVWQCVWAGNPELDSIFSRAVKEAVALHPRLLALAECIMLLRFGGKNPPRLWITFEKTVKIECYA
jgi:hypothetical protein